MRPILAYGILLLVHLFSGPIAYAAPSEMDWKPQVRLQSFPSSTHYSRHAFSKSESTIH
jgi:hypothetical protein